MKNRKYLLFLESSINSDPFHQTAWESLSLSILGFAYTQELQILVKPLQFICIDKALAISRFVTACIVKSLLDDLSYLRCFFPCTLVKQSDLNISLCFPFQLYMISCLNFISLLWVSVVLHIPLTIFFSFLWNTNYWKVPNSASISKFCIPLMLIYYDSFEELFFLQSFTWNQFVCFNCLEALYQDTIYNFWLLLY